MRRSPRSTLRPTSIEYSKRAAMRQTRLTFMPSRAEATAYARGQHNETMRACVILFSLVASAAPGAAQPPHPSVEAGLRAEQRAVSAFDAARDQGQLALQAFLTRMPKGADLHVHLAGAVYAETYLKDAADDRMCVDATTLSLLKSTSQGSGPPVCPQGAEPVSSAFRDGKLYDAMIDAFSMRSFTPSAGVDGHDHFFAAFDHFSALDSRAHGGEWLDELATRAEAQNEQYLEVMITPPFAHAAGLGYKLGWPTPSTIRAVAASSAPAPDLGASRQELASLRDKLLAGGLREEVVSDREQIDGMLADRKRIERCGSVDPAPACSVEVRVLYQVLRAFAPQQVFAQTLLAFEVAAADPAVVGLNFVQPEDAYLAMSEYHRQMLMLDYLHSVYPRVHITLHAGELALGLVPPAGLRFHIREAVDLGHAERIGHGVDVMEETDPGLLLKELSSRHIMIEMNLTSNDVILGRRASTHPLPDYLRAHVPVALSTDDEGVSRIDLTHEYTRAALDYKLSYADLKRSARTSVEHAFLPGVDLWQQPDQFTAVVRPCAAQPLGAETPNAACTEFLLSNPRAAQQWELEHRYRVFESAFVP